jgi:hypothetical protein
MHNLDLIIPTVTPGITAAIVGGTIARKTRQLYGLFRMAGATDPEHAATIHSLGFTPSWIFGRLVGARVIVAVPDGRYYLDEQAAMRRSRARKMIALFIFGGVIASLMALLFTGLIRL